tara:strand:- start:249 stop:908 length:660 start_codon:yes stop_codon:yes gene_type:complete
MPNNRRVVRATAVTIENAEEVIVQASHYEQPDLFPRVRTLENQLEKTNQLLADAKRELEMIKKQNADMKKENKKIKKEEADRLFTISEQQKEIEHEQFLKNSLIELFKRGEKFGWVTSTNGFKFHDDAFDVTWRFISQKNDQGEYVYLNRNQTHKELEDMRKEILHLKKRDKILEGMVRYHFQGKTKEDISKDTMGYVLSIPKTELEEQFGYCEEKVLD